MAGFAFLLKRSKLQSYALAFEPLIWRAELWHSCRCHCILFVVHSQVFRQPYDMSWYSAPDIVLFTFAFLSFFRFLKGEPGTYKTYRKPFKANAC